MNGLIIFCLVAIAVVWELVTKKIKDKIRKKRISTDSYRYKEYLKSTKNANRLADELREICEKDNTQYNYNCLKYRTLSFEEWIEKGKPIGIGDIEFLEDEVFNSFPAEYQDACRKKLVWKWYDWMNYIIETESYSGTDIFECVFVHMQELLDKKVATAKTEEEKRVNDSIQEFLNKRVIFYTLNSVQITGILNYLGVDNKYEREQMYHMINSYAQQYKDVKVVFK